MIFLASAFANFTGLLFAGDPIKFSTDPLPSETNSPVTEPAEKPKQPFKLFRAYRPADSISGSSIFQPGPNVPLPPPRVPPPARRDNEKMDREKNWAFISPDDKKKDDVSEAFGIDDVTLEPRKSALMRFLEKKPITSPTSSPGEKNRDRLTNEPETERDAEDKSNDKKSQVTTSLQPQYLEKKFVGTEAERTRFSEWNEQFGAEANRSREEKITKMKDFENLFSSQITAPPSGSGGVFDLNTTVAPMARPLDATLNRFDPNALAPSLDPLRGAARPIFGAGISGAASGRNAAALAPPVKSSLQPAPAKPVAQPSVLPFPKRQF